MDVDFDIINEMRREVGMDERGEWLQKSRTIAPFHAQSGAHPLAHSFPTRNRRALVQHTLSKAVDGWTRDLTDIVSVYFLPLRVPAIQHLDLCEDELEMVESFNPSACVLSAQIRYYNGLNLLFSIQILIDWPTFGNPGFTIPRFDERIRLSELLRMMAAIWGKEYQPADHAWAIDPTTHFDAWSKPVYIRAHYRAMIQFQSIYQTPEHQIRCVLQVRHVTRVDHNLD